MRFDETYFSFNAYGGSASGLLPTDRPNKFKAYAYYTINEGRKTSTDLGLFQFAYQGSPVASFIDVGYSVPPGNYFETYVEGRSNWVDVSGTTGNLTIGNARVRRTPWFAQTDFNLTQSYKISESKVLSFSAIIPNLLNQRSVTAYNSSIDSQHFGSFLSPGGLPFYYGAEAYSLYEPVPLEAACQHRRDYSQQQIWSAVPLSVRSHDPSAGCVYVLASTALCVDQEARPSLLLFCSLLNLVV